MYAIILDSKNYIKSYSKKYRTPGNILVEKLPEEDPEKLKCYQYINGGFVFDAKKWAAYEADQAESARRKEIMRNIAALKETLQSSDYQIIKCYEYAMNDLDLPYDVSELHLGRQALRDQINELAATL